jgi:hypothetical protein
MSTILRFHEKAQESKLRCVMHTHDLEQAIASIGRRRDLHPGTKIGEVRDHHAVPDKFLWWHNCAFMRRGSGSVHGKARRLPFGERAQGGHRVHQRSSKQPGLIGDLPGCRGDAEVHAACYRHLGPVRAADGDKVHRARLAREQQPGRGRRAERDAMRPGEIVAAPGRDNAEYAITPRSRLRHRARDGACHSVPADGHHPVAPRCCLGRQRARVPEAVALAGLVPDTRCIEYGSNGRQAPGGLPAAGGRVDNHDERRDHMYLYLQDEHVAQDGPNRSGRRRWRR